MYHTVPEGGEVTGEVEGTGGGVDTEAVGAGVLGFVEVDFGVAEGGFGLGFGDVGFTVAVGCEGFETGGVAMTGTDVFFGFDGVTFLGEGLGGITGSGFKEDIGACVGLS